MARQGSDPHGEEESSLAESRRGDQGVRPSEDEEPDFALDIPNLEIEEIDLEVEDLRAHVSARAELADFLRINIGVDAYLSQLKANIKGVKAQATLNVKLDKILGTIERALDVLEKDPSLLDPRARRASRERAEEWPEEPDRGPEQGILEAAGGTPEPGESGRIAATEAARRKARERGVDLSSIEGTGAAGRILVKDVERAARS